MDEHIIRIVRTVDGNVWCVTKVEGGFNYPIRLSVAHNEDGSNLTFYNDFFLGSKPVGNSPHIRDEHVIYEGEPTPEALESCMNAVRYFAQIGDEENGSTDTV